MKMVRIRGILSVIGILVVLVSSTFSHVHAADNSVKVSIPAFDVRVNEESVDSANLKYPLIVYNDITYFPLTWDWCNKLGLVSGFTNEDGLYIANYTSYIKPIVDDLDYRGSFSKDRVYNASVPTYPIHINGRLIDNNSEEYPLLNFNDVTYFPMTWRFVKEEFGWDKTWSDVEGFKLSSSSSLYEYGPGEQYESSYIFTLEEYDDFSIIQKATNYWSKGTEANDYGDYGNYNEGRADSYYKLDYNSNSLNNIESPEVLESQYNSGAITSEDISEQWAAKDNMLYYDNNIILDLSEDLLEDKTISGFWVEKYDCNGINVFSVSVIFMADGEVIPAPYTPRESYVFVANEKENLNLVENWPQYRGLSNVFSYGVDGVYLCSDSRYFGSSRYNNGQGFVMILGGDLSETILNDRWSDWSSVVALGTDIDGNLYLRNTWFPEYTIPNQYNGTVSPVNDGYFMLDTSGELTKIYPFIEAEHVTVTPTGDIYIDAGWADAIIHLQTEEWITPN